MSVTAESAPAVPLVDAPPAPPRRRFRWKWSHFMAYVILVPGAILFAAPLVWLISASFQPVGDLFSYPPHWIPQHTTLEGYKAFFGHGSTASARANAPDGVARWFLNSAFVTGMTTACQVFFNALAAYVFAKRRFPGRDIIFIAFLATMMVPANVTLIPNYLVIKHIPFVGGNDWFGLGGHGLLDSYYGLILPNAVAAFGIFFLRQYMLSIPDELLDSARIDGASEWKIFWKIIIPLSRPALAAMAIFTFTYVWEDFLWPLIVISSPDHYTAPLGLALFVTKNRTSWDMLLAGSVIATIPMIIVFLFFQRHLIKGLTVGAVKG
jgi:multiple sugar transport system permease protein